MTSKREYVDYLRVKVIGWILVIGSSLMIAATIWTMFPLTKLEELLKHPPGSASTEWQGLNQQLWVSLVGRLVCSVIGFIAGSGLLKRRVWARQAMSLFCLSQILLQVYAIGVTMFAPWIMAEWWARWPFLIKPAILIVVDGYLWWWVSRLDDKAFA